MREKKYQLRAEDFKELVKGRGGCIASDMITVNGRPVGYMYRELPTNDVDTGWRFMAGDETDEYVNDVENLSMYAVNTIANHDADIIPFLNAPIGSEFERNSITGNFELVDGPIDPDDCLHPRFPVVTGDYRLTPTWAVSLPRKFNRRVEDDELILWRPGMTIYLVAWDNRMDSVETRLAQFESEASPAAFEPIQARNGLVVYHSYRLIEDGIHALHGLAVTNRRQLQVAVYCDKEDDVDLARRIFSSVCATGD